MAGFWRVISMVLCGLVVSSCVNGKLVVSPPSRWNVIQDAPPGPPGFKQGWKDGCETALSAGVNPFYIRSYKYQLHYAMAKSDPDYNIGRAEATWFCGRYGERYGMLGEDKYGGLL